MSSASRARTNRYQGGQRGEGEGCPARGRVLTHGHGLGDCRHGPPWAPQRLVRGRAHLSYEDEKFSYLIVRRGPRPTPARAPATATSPTKEGTLHALSLPSPARLLLLPFFSPRVRVQVTEMWPAPPPPQKKKNMFGRPLARRAHSRCVQLAAPGSAADAPHGSCHLGPVFPAGSVCARQAAALAEKDARHPHTPRMPALCGAKRRAAGVLERRVVAKSHGKSMYKDARTNFWGNLWPHALPAGKKTVARP